MTTWFLAFLALIWIGVFLPGAARARRRTPLPAAIRFKRIMGSIAPPRPSPRHAAPRPAARPTRSDSGRWVIAPHSERSRQKAAVQLAQRRRRRLLAVLGGAVIVSAVVAVLRGQPWLEIHLILDGMLLFYVALLHETKRRRDERHSKVRILAPREDDEVQVLSPMSVGGEHS